nr:adaptin ear-binding coat-associated protein 2 [Quercus suber]
MASIDPAIERVLFVAQNVHVYGIPPLTSTRGFNASSWTSPTQPTAQQIFTARLRILETSTGLKITAQILLEDANTGELFAGAPYTAPAVVQQAQDSSRFFALRVVGEGGMKATLGIGFEDRSPAFDFSIALGDVRKVLGFDNPAGPTTGSSSRGLLSKIEADSKTDFSLKEGEKITIQLGGKGRRHMVEDDVGSGTNQDDSAALFSIAPPPGAANGPTSAPTYSIPQSSTAGQSARGLGFDDGEFGEFQ